MKWRDLAEHQIQKAKAQGQLDNLQGEGKPLPHRAGGDVVSAGMGIMADAGVLPREIELKKAVDAQLEKLKAAKGTPEEKDVMRKLADLQMKLAIEQEARRKFYSTS
ncbi:DUF1992 domain-containing protein [Alisedimentitalea sp. MJ-SS2]|uniref:DnaJ family domain-containing protein n=1 Tax=Aliisedimentitalea sp. MJ-SS2 TaxID=3049795 RepID=UPI002907780C|nr:DUF1992 domain-containing protein [Alisedimentitalea sp. MJ-SS2]MDU8927820.1 DUF1992 domain-containing protein [Alisedimentitalea sp. MJ-SS2]